MPRKKKDDTMLNEQAAEILALAEDRGVQSNYFFRTTFQRYQTQLKILAELQKEIEKKGPTTTTTTAKGEVIEKPNPAITEYNKTAVAANGTVITLQKIINGFAKDEKAKASRLETLMQEANVQA